MTVFRNYKKGTYVVLLHGAKSRNWCIFPLSVTSSYIWILYIWHLASCWRDDSVHYKSPKPTHFNLESVCVCFFHFVMMHIGTVATEKRLFFRIYVVTVQYKHHNIMEETHRERDTFSILDKICFFNDTPNWRWFPSWTCCLKPLLHTSFQVRSALSYSSILSGHWILFLPVLPFYFTTEYSYRSLKEADARHWP